MAGETYVKRYPAGFVDLPSTTTPVDSTFLNAVETALLRLLGEDPLADEVGVWVPASNRFVFQKIVNAQIDAAAAIDKSKLGALNIVNADIAASAAIAKSKLAALNIADADIVAGASIAKSKLAALSIVDADVSAGAAIAAAKLAAGSSGQLLVTSGATPAWATRIQAGTASFSALANATGYEQTVTFPTAFAVAPAVVVSIRSSSVEGNPPVAPLPTLYARTVTTTNFVLGVWNVNNANNLVVQWLAVQF